MERSTSMGTKPSTVYIHLPLLAVQRNAKYQLPLKTSFPIFFGGHNHNEPEDSISSILYSVCAIQMWFEHLSIQYNMWVPGLSHPKVVWTYMLYGIFKAGHYCKKQECKSSWKREQGERNLNSMVKCLVEDKCLYMYELLKLHTQDFHTIREKFQDFIWVPTLWHIM